MEMIITALVSLIGVLILIVLIKKRLAYKTRKELFGKEHIFNAHVKRTSPLLKRLVSTQDIHNNSLNIEWLINFFKVDLIEKMVSEYQEKSIKELKNQEHLRVIAQQVSEKLESYKKTSNEEELYQKLNLINSQLSPLLKEKTNFFKKWLEELIKDNPEKYQSFIQKEKHEQDLLLEEKRKKSKRKSSSYSSSNSDSSSYSSSDSSSDWSSSSSSSSSWDSGGGGFSGGGSSDSF